MAPNTRLPGEPGSSAHSQSATFTTSMTPTTQIHQRQRNDESWVEVSSHPSSSVSSIGEEIVTTGLQVSSSSRPQQRRRLQQRAFAQIDATQTTRMEPPAGSSSQEEYDETESEEDHFLTSSTENFFSTHSDRQNSPGQSLPRSHDPNSSDEEEDDDENTTALGRRPSEPFCPQPNAFSHPPSHLTHRHSTSSAIPQHNRRSSFTRRSYSRAERHNFMSTNYQADNDAALRASLSTLLRCAAAARSLPKDGDKELPERPGRATGNQPVSLRFASESELMAPSPPTAPSRGVSQPANTSSKRPSPPAPAPAPAHAHAPAVAVAGEKVKRAATPPAGPKPPRATKKKRVVHGEDALISPTLLTWVVSAGVVVLVSIVGFGAGYVIGREVGRRETLGNLSGIGNMSAISDGGSCGREAIRSSGGTLRRFRWGAGMGRSIAA
ncbi:hypothetical protein GGS21DRAFT_84793 [Xylaria nigripes]|nr:hypothetical protein GGS21DRAFT_84793 [Xylaria nigripes]